MGGMGDDPGGPEKPPVNGYATQPARIYVDENTEDWAELSVQYTDGDDGDGVDLERLKAAHSDRYLFLQLAVDQPLNLQEGNALSLYLDTDDDPTTGTEALGTGAELSWTFGDRSGQVWLEGETQEVGHADVGLTSLPTVRADTFEIALDRTAEPLGSTPLFQGDSLRIAVSSGGDRLPDDDGGVGYVLSETDIGVDAPTIDRPNADAVRMLSYNVRRDALFDAEVQPHYRRILETVGPDVIGFQEIYQHSAQETERVVGSLVEAMDDWHWAKAGSDLVVGSRYSILETHPISGYENYQSLAALLDASSALGSNLLVIDMHPPCCSGSEDGGLSRDEQRQRVVDGVAAFLRAVKQGEGPFTVAPDTPIIVLGDMNFVGAAQQPRTLRTGEIVNTDRFGAGAAPDWDGSPLLDANPRQTATPMHTTWIDPESSFPPGRLDYAYVSDHVLEVVHAFVLRTSVLPDSVLTAHDLRASDTGRASDHLPVVVDVATDAE